MIARYPLPKGVSVSIPGRSLSIGFGKGIAPLRSSQKDESRAVTLTIAMMRDLCPDLQGKTLGLVGFGRVAQRVAALAALRYGMRVIVADPSAIPGSFCNTLGVAQVTLDDLMAQSDVVSLHCWNAADTRGLISGPQLDLMQDHAILIDTVGEGVVDRQALFQALSFDMLAGAGVDVAHDKGALPSDLMNCGTCIVAGAGQSPA